MASRSAGQTMVPAVPGKPPATMRPGSGTEEGPGSPGGQEVVAGICISLVTCQLFRGGYEVQSLPEGIMGCNNETAGSFDAGPSTEEL